MRHIIIPAIICVIFILLGYLSEKYPRIISGYEKLNTEFKKTVPNFVKKVSMITGLIIVLGCALSLLLNDTILYTFFLILPIFAMPLAIILKIYNGSNRVGRSILVVYILALAVIIGFTIYSTSSTQVNISNKELSISGLYGETISKSNVKNVEWMDGTPSLGLRTNGFSLGYVKKGNFRYNGTSAKVFIETENKPSVILHLTNNKLIILSLKDQEEMSKIYNSLK